MVDVKVHTVIKKPRKKVFAFASEPKNEIRWIGGITDSWILTKGGVTTGTQVKRTAKFMGKEIEYVMEVVVYMRDSQIVMQSIKSPFPMKVIYNFSDQGDGTLVELHVQGTTKGFYKLASPLVKMKVRKNLEEDLRRLKAILES